MRSRPSRLSPRSTPTSGYAREQRPSCASRAAHRARAHAHARAGPLRRGGRCLGGRQVTRTPAPSRAGQRACRRAGRARRTRARRSGARHARLRSRHRVNSPFPSMQRARELERATRELQTQLRMSEARREVRFASRARVRLPARSTARRPTRTCAGGRQRACRRAQHARPRPEGRPRGGGTRVPPHRHGRALARRRCALALGQRCRRIGHRDGA